MHLQKKKKKDMMCLDAQEINSKEITKHTIIL